MGTLRRAVKNFFVNFMAHSWCTITDVAAMGLLARYLSSEQFGTYALITAFVATFRMISSMGIPTIITRDLAINKEKGPDILTAGIGIQLLLSLLTIGITTSGVFLFYFDTKVILITLFATLAVVFQFLSHLFESIPRAYEKMEYEALENFITQGFLLGLTFLAIKLGYGLAGIFIYMALSRFIGLLYISWVVLKKFVRPRLSWKPDLWKYLILEGYPIGLRRLIRQIAIRIDTLILAGIKSKTEVGLFHGVYKIVQGLMGIGESAANAVFPVISKYYGNSKEKFDLAYEQSIKLLIIVGAFLGIFLFVFSEDILVLVLGKKFLPAVVVLQIFSPVVLLMFLTKLTERVMISGHRQKLATAVVVVTLVVNAGADFLLIPKYGIIGAAIATLIAEIILIALSLYYIYKEITSFPIYGLITKSFIAYGVACFISWVLNAAISPIACFIIGIISFMTLLFIFQIISYTEYNLVKMIFMKKTLRVTNTSG